MDRINKKTLEALIESSRKSFYNSASNRKSLHTIEWESTNSSPSILGEVEVRSDTVLAISKSCLKMNTRGTSDLTHKLEKASICNSTAIKSWIQKEGSNFKIFSDYIFTIETLRKATISYLEEQNF